MGNVGTSPIAELDVKQTGNHTNCCIGGSVQKESSESSEFSSMEELEAIHSILASTNYKRQFKSLMTMLGLGKEYRHDVTRIIKGIVHYDNEESSSTNTKKYNKSIAKLLKVKPRSRYIIREWFRMVGYSIHSKSHTNSLASFFADRVNSFFDNYE